MMTRTGLIIGLLVSICATMNAQEDEYSAYYYEVDSTEYETTFGPNTAYYQHGFISYGMPIPIIESDSLRTKWGGVFLEYGSRGKIKVAEWLALGWEVSYQYNSQSIVQDSVLNLLSLGEVFEKQQIKKHVINSGIHVRFNAGRRGNNLGKYVDLGGFTSFVAGSRMILVREEDRNQVNFGSAQQRTVLKRINFTSPFQYGASVRIGLNGFILWGRYTLNDSFRKQEEVNNGIQLPNLTPLTAGIQLAF